MRHALAIVKHLPAVLCGLLVVAWTVSVNHDICVRGRRSRENYAFGIARGDLYFETYYQGSWIGSWIESRRLEDREKIARSALGKFERVGRTNYFDDTEWWLTCPILFCLSLLLPLAIAPFTRFRFPLWSYFAWTALVAAELAYYLR